MFGSENRLLTRLFRARAAASATHRETLERTLMAGFDRREPSQERSPVTLFRLRPVLIAAASLAVLGGAAVAAPASIGVAVGRSLDITVPDGFTLDPASLATVFGDDAGNPNGPGHQSLAIRMERESETSGSTLHLDVWGTSLPSTPLADLVRAKIPALKDAAIRETTLNGNVPSSLAGFLAHELFDTRIDDESLEAAKARVMEELAKQGVDPVDVQVESATSDDGTSAQMKVRVEKREISLDDSDGKPVLDKPIRIPTGARTTIRVPFETGDIEVGTPGVVDVTAAGPGSVILTAKGAGSSRVTLYDSRSRAHFVEMTIEVE